VLSNITTNVTLTSISFTFLLVWLQTHLAEQFRVREKGNLFFPIPCKSVATSFRCSLREAQGIAISLRECVRPSVCPKGQGPWLREALNKRNFVKFPPALTLRGLKIIYITEV
jgi:hypothetical protein